MAKPKKLQVSKNDVTLTDNVQSELQKLAEDKSLEILQKINATTERIAEAKQVVDSAAAMKSGWLGRSRKMDAIANALVATIAALPEIIILIQESIRFTCSSIEFAHVMHKTMAYMMVHGFKDTNGNMTELSSDSKEFVQIILNEAEDFATKQFAVEKKQAEMHQRLDEKDKIDEEQNQRLEKLEIAFENEKEKINKTFDEKNKIDKEQSKQLNNLQKILDENDKIDEEQNLCLEKLKIAFEDEQKKINKTFDKKSKIDREQSKQLNNLQKLLGENAKIDEKQEKEISRLDEHAKQEDILGKEQSEKIQKIMSDLKSGIVRKNVTLVLSIIALVISVGTLVFFIWGRYSQ